jgi:hypothetical protein
MWPAGRAPERLPCREVLIDVPHVLHDQIARANRRAEVRVLLPSKIRTPFDRLYPGATIRPGSYDLNLGSVKGCHEATACFVASFLGEHGTAKPFGPRRVPLARGRVGRFTPTSCGASCAAPQVQWREKGVLYTIQARIGTKGSERRRLVALADSAIRAGAR